MLNIIFFDKQMDIYFVEKKILYYFCDIKDFEPIFLVKRFESKIKQ